MEEADLVTNPEYSEDAIVTKWGKKNHRVAKVFSYTFWRTQIEEEVFWTIQGHDDSGAVWIVTEYFGPPEEANRYQQEVTVRHPGQPKIRIDYNSRCYSGKNCIRISKDIVRNFKNKDNTLKFEFRILRLKRNPYPQRMMW